MGPFAAGLAATNPLDGLIPNTIYMDTTGGCHLNLDPLDDRRMSQELYKVGPACRGCAAGPVQGVGAAQVGRALLCACLRSSGLKEAHTDSGRAMSIPLLR